MGEHKATDEDAQAADVAARPYLWSDEAHTAQSDGQLVFWRFAFTPTYERTEIVRKITSVFAQRGIASFTLYEVFGEWDVLVRAWLPREEHVDTLDAALQRVLAVNSFDMSDYMVVTTTPRHWVWKPNGSDGGSLVDARPSMPLVKAVSAHNRRYCQGLRNYVDIEPDSGPEKADVGLESFAEQLDLLQRGGWLRQFNPERHGVKFFITYGTPSRALRPSEKEVALKRIIETCDRVVDAAREYQDDEDAPPEISVYSGTGTMTNFIIMAKAPDKHFYRFARDLVFGLNEGTDIDKLYSSRPYTHVMADRRFMAFRDEIRVDEVPFDEVLLEQDESEALEFKASFAADVNRFVVDGKWHAFDEGPKEILRAICGLLNAPSGGKLVIGVQEIDHVKHSPERRLAALSSFELRGNKALLGAKPDIEASPGLRNWDGLRLRIADLIAQMIKPVAAPFISIDPYEVGDATLTVISVRPSGASWFFANVDGAQRFFVRELGRTVEYQGTDGDYYRRTNPRGAATT